MINEVFTVGWQRIQIVVEEQKCKDEKTNKV
jgi:hypothetical protein